MIEDINRDRKPNRPHNEEEGPMAALVSELCCNHGDETTKPDE